MEMPLSEIQKISRWIRRPVVVFAIPVLLVTSLFQRIGQAAKSLWLGWCTDIADDFDEAKRWWR